MEEEDNQKQRRKREQLLNLIIARNLSPAKSLTFCGKNLSFVQKNIKMDEYADILQDPNKETVSLGGLYHCNNNGCPICSIFKSERDTKKMIVGEKLIKKEGGSCIFGTLTFRHIGDLEQWKLLGKPGNKKDRFGLRGALSQLKEGTPWVRFNEKYGVRAVAWALDTTFGGPRSSGTHFHEHCVIFLDKELSDIELKEMQKWLYDRWIICCKDNGLSEHGNPTEERGVVLERPRKGENASKYIIKGGWALAQEIGNGSGKKAKVKGRYTVSQLLEFLLDPTDCPLPKNYLEKLIRDYFTVTARRQMVNFNKGFDNSFWMAVDAILKEEKKVEAEANLLPESEEELTPEIVDDLLKKGELKQVLGRIHWQLLGKMNGRILNSDFLTLIEEFGIEEARSCLEEILKMKISDRLLWNIEDSYIVFRDRKGRMFEDLGGGKYRWVEWGMLREKSGALVRCDLIAA